MSSPTFFLQKKREWYVRRPTLRNTKKLLSSEVRKRNKKYSYIRNQVILCISNKFAEYFQYGTYSCASHLLNKVFFPFFSFEVANLQNFLVKCQRGREVKWHEIFISSYYASMSNVDDFGPNIFLLGICRKNQIYRYEKTSSLWTTKLQSLAAEATIFQKFAEECIMGNRLGIYPFVNKPIAKKIC